MMISGFCENWEEKWSGVHVQKLIVPVTMTSFFESHNKCKKDARAISERPPEAHTLERDNICQWQLLSSFCTQHPHIIFYLFFSLKTKVLKVLLARVMKVKWGGGGKQLYPIINNLAAK